jgi:glc operon protein GlcG
MVKLETMPAMDRRVARSAKKHRAEGNRSLAMRMKPSLTFSDAQTVSGACLEAATARGVSVCVAVADEAGNLVHFCRMDGARSHTIDLARGKATLAATVGVATAVIEQLQRQRPAALPPGFPGAGGVPVLVDNQCAGAIGVSGASPEIDDAIAQHGVASLTAGLLQSIS